MEDQDRIKENLKELFFSQKLAVLASNMHEQPYTSLVAFAATEDLQHIIFATNRHTHKYRNISENQRVAFLIDNRSIEDKDFQKTTAVTALGTCVEAAGEEKEKLISLFTAKHPHLEKFVTSKDTALLKVSVEWYYAVSEFQKVVELHMM